MKCYYEELGVERNADEVTIKTAYRKLALRWHPDKNRDCTEEAKERFQLIQQAFEVLSDPLERTWYDSHRDQILRGRDSEYVENSLDLFPYFTGSCFKGYGDDPKGFYAVYKNVFEKLVAEDAEFMTEKDELAEIPTFGNSKSSYEDLVGPFYAYWQSYCTKKSYSWLCPYNIQEMRDRRVLRIVDKEMKKIVQKAKKERNEEVRQLVAFIRKRDRRVQQYRRQLEERAALNRQKQEQNRLEQIRRRQQELKDVQRTNGNALNEGYEELLRQLESVVDDEEKGASDEDDYEDDLYCVACNKSFKNEKAFANHETSKKHRENVHYLKEEMREQDEAYRGIEEDKLSSSNEHEDEIELHSDVDGIEEDLPSELPEVDSERSSLSECEENVQKRPNKKQKKKSKKTTAQFTETSDVDESGVEKLISEAKAGGSSEDDGWDTSAKKNTKKNKNKKLTKKPNQGRTAPNTTNNTKAKQQNQPSQVESTSLSAAENRKEPAATTTPHTCATCHSTFESKNKLFTHLKNTNHSVYLPKGKTERGPEELKSRRNKAP